MPETWKSPLREEDRQALDKAADIIRNEMETLRRCDECGLKFDKLKERLDELAIVVPALRQRMLPPE